MREKGIQSFPLTRARFHTILSHPTPAKVCSEALHGDRPRPLRGGGFSFFSLRRKYSGGGVMSDSIHLPLAHGEDEYLLPPLPHISHQKIGNALPDFPFCFSKALFPPRFHAAVDLPAAIAKLVVANALRKERNDVLRGRFGDVFKRLFRQKSLM